MRRKTVLFLCLLTSMAGILSGCGGNKTGETSAGWDMATVRMAIKSAGKTMCREENMLIHYSISRNFLSGYCRQQKG